MYKKAILFFIIFFAAYFPNVIFAETVVLKTGKKIEGEIIEKTAQATGVKTDLEKSANSQLKEKNAAVIYEEAMANLIKSFPDDFIANANNVINNGWSEHHNDLKEILSQNKEAIDLFKVAARLPYCDFTLGKKVEKTAYGPLPKPSGGSISLARLVLLEAKLYEKEGKMELALNNYISVLKMISHLDQQQNFILIYKVSGMIIQNMIYAPLAQYIVRKDLTLQECKVLQDTLLFMKDNIIVPEKLLDSIKEERQIFNQSLTEQKTQGKSSKYFVGTVPRELGVLYEKYDKYLVEAVRKNSPEIIDEKINELNEELEKEKEKAEKGDWRLAVEALKKIIPGLSNEIDSYNSKLLFSLETLGHLRYINQYYTSLAKEYVLLAGVSIKLYEIKNGWPPDNLQALVSDYISVLPEDPFNNFEALKFIKKEKRWVVYSIGPDRVDNQASIIHSGIGGSKEEAGDIVFSSP